jgi:hypothetical protein
VLAVICRPSLASSPWMRRCPRDGFSARGVAPARGSAGRSLADRTGQERTSSAGRATAGASGAGWPGDDERRPAGPGQQPGQGGQHHAVVRAQLGAVHLPPQDRDLVVQDQQFDVLGAAVAGELGQHLQDLPDEQVHQRGAHGRILAVTRWMASHKPARQRGRPNSRAPQVRRVPPRTARNAIGNRPADGSTKVDHRPAPPPVSDREAGMGRAKWYPCACW